MTKKKKDQMVFFLKFWSPLRDKKELEKDCFSVCLHTESLAAGTSHLFSHTPVIHSNANNSHFPLFSRHLTLVFYSFCHLKVVFEIDDSFVTRFIRLEALGESQAIKLQMPSDVQSLAGSPHFLVLVLFVFISCALFFFF